MTTKLPSHFCSSGHLLKRSSGVLCHFSCLPAPYGIGDLGPAAYRFADFLNSAGQSWWQILPTCPTEKHFSHSPYMSCSAFAGSPLLISPDLLVADGYLQDSELQYPGTSLPYTTDYDTATLFKNMLIELVADRFDTTSATYLSFVEQQPWLRDYALYMALKKHHQNAPWYDWPKEYCLREPEALNSFSKDNWRLLQRYYIEQFLFFSQYQKLHRYCLQRGIGIFGDLPIYVSLDSVDVWCNADLFSFGEQFPKPDKVAGVPPDYFSETGQRWGNPLYNWNGTDLHVRRGLLGWWRSRLVHQFKLNDLVRIDHFRGFESYWAVPESEATAMNGQWEKGPGEEFFKEIFRETGLLPIVAEDLGIITPEVTKLRERLGFPGMKVLQFGFDNDPYNPHLPHNYESSNCVVYTGTHDNDTTVGWYLSAELSEEMRREIKAYANREAPESRGINWDFIYLASSSIARLCILPLQDLLGFGSDCRMNTPGTAEGNWLWRCPEHHFSSELASELRSITRRFARLPETSEIFKTSTE